MDDGPKTITWRSLELRRGGWLSEHSDKACFGTFEHVEEF